MDDSGEWKDRDEIQERFQELNKNLKSAMGFRVRVAVQELREHLRARARHHREQARLLEGRLASMLVGNHLARQALTEILRRRREAALAFDFCAGHLVGESFDLTLEEATQLEFLESEHRYDEERFGAGPQ